MVTNQLNLHHFMFLMQYVTVAYHSVRPTVTSQSQPEMDCALVPAVANPLSLATCLTTECTSTKRSTLQNSTLTQVPQIMQSTVDMPWWWRPLHSRFARCIWTQQLSWMRTRDVSLWSWTGLWVMRRDVAKKKASYACRSNNSRCIDSTSGPGNPATALKAIMAILIFPVDAKVCTASLSCLAWHKYKILWAPNNSWGLRIRRFCSYDFIFAS